MEFLSKSPEETKKIAADLAQKIIKTKKGAVIAMEGELGAGKTTFIQGFIASLGIDEKVKSPTFVIMKKYSIHGGTYRGTNLYHLDCYRIADHKDLRIPEFEEILNEEGSIVFIEWAERIREILPKNHLTVHIDHIDNNQRKIKITG